jgi:hypothetical protein
MRLLYFYSQGLSVISQTEVKRAIFFATVGFEAVVGASQGQFFVDEECAARDGHPTFFFCLDISDTALGICYLGWRLERH